MATTESKLTPAETNELAMLRQRQADFKTLAKNKALTPRQVLHAEQVDKRIAELEAK